MRHSDRAPDPRSPLHTLLAGLRPSHTARVSWYGRGVLVYLMGLFYVVAGVSHFTSAGFFRQLVPPFLPAPEALVVISGVAEVVLGVLVMIPATRRVAAWGIMALLVAVYPANIHQAIANPVLVDPPAWIGQPSQMALVGRLPLQFVLMYWAWRYTR